MGEVGAWLRRGYGVVTAWSWRGYGEVTAWLRRGVLLAAGCWRFAGGLLQHGWGKLERDWGRLGRGYGVVKAWLRRGHGVVMGRLRRGSGVACCWRLVGCWLVGCWRVGAQPARNPPGTARNRKGAAHEKSPRSRRKQTHRAAGAFFVGCALAVPGGPWWVPGRLLAVCWRVPVAGASTAPLRATTHSSPVAGDWLVAGWLASGLQAWRVPSAFLAGSWRVAAAWLGEVGAWLRRG